MGYVCLLDNNEWEQRLKEAGQHLASPPSSTTDLLHLLDKTEELLTYVEQAPSISMQGAIVPSMGALVADGLVNHSEVDVRISVASCLCEVARITAPEPPYRDVVMKAIFQLNVLAFGQLSNVTGHSYHKAVHILESVAKVKSCLLMLDLECDALVLEMFEQFLSQIRVDQPHTVFTDMETIMTIIVEESDEIATEILSLLISHVKKENQIDTPASWKLAEKVLRNCNNTLKSYSGIILKLINSNPGDYAEVVTALCQNPQENSHVATRSTRTNSIHKMDLNTLENGNQLKEKKLETSRRGRPRKHKNNVDEDYSPNLVQKSQEDTRRTRFQGKKQNGDIKNSGSVYNVVIKKEDDIISDYDGAEPLTHQTNYKKIQKKRKASTVKRIANCSRGKDPPKKWRQDLVGHRIKVWWPLDKMFYEGAVSSYNPSDLTYKILYADGDEELLNLHNEKWMMLDEISPDQQREHAAELPTRRTPAKRRKLNGERKLESAIKQEENSSSPKRTVNCLNSSPSPTDISKTLDVICNADDQKNNPVLAPAISCGLNVTEKATDDIGKIGDLNLNGELQEMNLSESRKITQRQENTDNLISET